MKKVTNSENFSLTDFFTLNKMITPAFITIIYWITLVFIAIGGLSMIFASFASFQYSFFGGMFTLISGIITLVVGIISARIGFELICVLFNINRNIEKLALNKNDSITDGSDDHTIMNQN
ncbi:DUF4282 domain-containing protein [Gilliamella sp. B2776]|uniref:DUF4282 domain-containing protein n=1 Tax=unclassified Gilliamella TaxID=2685620 RepID=UPI00226AE47E|nr:MULTISPECIES: DUF4282 domain-containing protein [unclassified Gilliamella]MCX8650087.1 DUF4282 domain-containing protein [Gilliamella sp. B2779]MCX8655020.1 DUF4282 domain-containing protein [Gilliamella sp. B2737]MCX8656618.1 DUF4282 domain-containing protein [Gilliamella sp. B2894]MCX8665409.1 DUF4282 domain-containing protein [Gilliamella sp. B2887]MCX8691860.1 DUF4282 domain-containing protein [Gilliamella sp. B2776]